ncbi:protochlorophyllide-dependent translocon component 52, chloroplastic-like [Bidens hawaiensis]|uniref:protochlorophyllide-dependent translocon component 52, chloroplastic-like n=1 Tax=Bidens hawaiensis TaxID=980011 RepID=UPI00404A6213
MEALRTASTLALPSRIKAHLSRPNFGLSFTHKTPNLTHVPKYKFTAISSSVSTEEETRRLDQDEKFDWFSHWYPLVPVCDLDKRSPRGMKVLGLDVVEWWDRNENERKVFDDRCPHRLAPLSQGRIDQWGRLQCVYHGWFFDGSDDCKFIPQAPQDGPPVHSSPKACAFVYPSTVQNGIVWFWPNTDSRYKDILARNKPPCVPELDDPSFSVEMFTRDIPYGYEILVENLMDPSHVPYAHHGIMSIAPPPSVKFDREGGSPIDIKMQKIDKTGFTAIEQLGRQWSFVSPCLVQGIQTIKESSSNAQGKLAQKPPQKVLFIFFCIPVSLGNSRLIIVSSRNYSLWIDPFVSRWMNHILQNLVIDSDLYLLRVQEEKLMKAGPSNWQKCCFVPTKADTMVAFYRTWLKKYAGGQVYWGTNINGHLPPISPREQLMDRYWSHVVNCSCCIRMYKGLNALQISLQVFSIASMAIMGATKQGVISGTTRITLAVAAILCFVGSKWLSQFIYKNFHFHDYDHAFK